MNILKDLMEGQAILNEEYRRLDRVKIRIAKQVKKLNKINKKLGYMTIPNPVIEETDNEYTKRINRLNLRVGVDAVVDTLIDYKEYHKGYIVEANGGRYEEDDELFPEVEDADSKADRLYDESVAKEINS